MKKKRGQNEGTIFEERPGRWVAQLMLGYRICADGKRRPVRKKFTATTRNAVQKKLTAALREQQTGGIVPLQKDSLGVLLDRFPAQLRAKGRAEATIASYRWMIDKYIVPDIGKTPLTQLTQVDVNEFMQRKIEAGLSPRTVQYCHAIIRSALSRGERDGLVSRNVAKLAEPPGRTHKTKVEPLTAEDSRRFLEAVKAPPRSAVLGRPGGWIAPR